MRGDRQRQREPGILMRRPARVESVRIFFGDEAGIEVARGEARLGEQRRLEAMLLATPRTTKPSSASRIVAIAAARSVPTAISLQIIES